MGNEYYVFACCQEKEVVNTNDGCSWQEPRSMYSTNIWLKQHHAKRDCKLLKISYLVYFDWYEEVEMKAHNILSTVARISDCNKFLSASVNQLYWYVITLFALCVSIDLHNCNDNSNCLQSWRHLKICKFDKKWYINKACSCLLWYPAGIRRTASMCEDLKFYCDKREPDLVPAGYHSKKCFPQHLVWRFLPQVKPSGWCIQKLPALGLSLRDHLFWECPCRGALPYCNSR